MLDVEAYNREVEAEKEDAARIDVMRRKAVAALAKEGWGSSAQALATSLRFTRGRVCRSAKGAMTSPEAKAAAVMATSPADRRTVLFTP